VSRSDQRALPIHQDIGIPRFDVGMLVQPGDQLGARTTIQFVVIKRLSVALELPEARDHITEWT
jgi:hypothetical protein